MKNFTLRLFLLIPVICLSQTLSAQVPALNSLSTANATIYLDFDGHTVNSYAWNGGARLDCSPAILNASQITEIFNRVSEDYRPFNINITTDSAKFLAAPVAQRIRIIVTPTSAWYPGVGGVSYIGSFTWGDDTPGFVFTDKLGNNPKYIAECCSHESGHTVGLSHQSTYDSNCNLVDPYSTGTGTGEISWAPVMGNSYYKNMTGWNDGPTPYGCSLKQDNLTIITATNGFSYRADDYTEALDNNTYNLGTDNFSSAGIITTTTDNDAFKFTTTRNAAFHLEVAPFGVNNSSDAANLDVKVFLYNAAKTLINTFNAPELLSVIKDTNLIAGTYYIIVSGTGSSNTSDYGSLGSYTVKGSAGLLAIHDISLAGNTANAKHNLSWKVTADEPVKSQTVEVSTNGRDFTALSEQVASSRSFIYQASQSAVLYYRIKVTSVINEVAYSNIIALKVSDAKDNIFTVSSFIHDQITINAKENYQYILYDINGKMIFRGNGAKGTANVAVAGKPAGIYIIQLLSNNYKQTERIIKQ